ncbi:MAG TPA: bifunctional diaminohydroxyphosphoribosylaminopyrimidine deaminase/5-amino-6-(5-phosphoribosylamino)uracil reductase RibD [Candidatus Omnitrophota bacterium]|nr:bifunctional diaminohydroxyphosphoribosylaminopyrimidine deaminase/5-amino-6-(5-phosphoribosylamino)uracil reductase RibD [Candidatus Omnitrophota bacterium]
MTLPPHEHWMRRALALAEKGRFTVSPNPMVGACVVSGGKLVGSGFHEKFGGPHAEPNAFKKAGKKAKGATLYVTLEPCSTWQKTPPCAPLIKEQGIKKVVVGCLDPNPLNRGKGIRFLRQQGISVTVGVLEKEVRRQNEGFFTYVKEKRPFVTLKMAQTLDGKIATREGLSRWISSPLSRKFVHKLRSQQDAVLVGENTFYQDDPRFTVSPGAVSFKKGKPWKVAIISSRGCPAKARIFDDPRMAVLVFPERDLGKIVKQTSAQKRSLMLLPVRTKNGRIEIRELLKKLAGLGITRLLLEGGGELAWSFLEAGCVDRAYWILAPKVFGGRDAKTSIEGLGVKTPDRAFIFRPGRVTRLGDDWLFEGTFHKK